MSSFSNWEVDSLSEVVKIVFEDVAMGVEDRVVSAFERSAVVGGFDVTISVALVAEA